MGFDRVASPLRALSLSVVLSLLAHKANAAEIQILAPPVVANAGLSAIAAGFTQKTGIQVTIRSLELLKIPQSAVAEPTDIVFATSALISGMAKDNSIKPARAVGRVNIGLAVPAGAAHPDISTTAKLIAALRSSRGVVYSNPDPARGSLGAIMIDRLLKRPDFAGIHGVISAKGNGASGLMNGEGDSALQFESEILPHKEIELVGALPQALGAFVDISVAALQKSPHPAEAQAFLDYVTAAQSAPLWAAGGLSATGP